MNRSRNTSEDRPPVAALERSEDADAWTTHHTYFAPNTVVSRDADGKPLSFYKDGSWNLRSLSGDGTSPAMLHFFDASVGAEPNLAKTIREQHKALMWLHIDAGKIRALVTVRNTNLAARAWCQRAHSRGIDLFALLTNVDWVTDELKSLNLNYLHLSSSLISTLWRNRKMLGVGANIPLQELKAAINEEAKSRPEYNQTPLIPSRIYCAILAGLLKKMDEIEGDLTALLDLYRQCKNSLGTSHESGTGEKDSRLRNDFLASNVASLGLWGYDPMQHFSIDQFITGRVNFYQLCLMHVVVAFTGMRKGEVSILPLYGVTTTFEDLGSTHYQVNGFTTKLNGGIKSPCSWITSREGFRAIGLAKRIATVILEERGGPPRINQSALLFPSTDDPFRSKSKSSIESGQELLNKLICPEIVQTDIDELNFLELERGWQREGIDVGKPWPLTFHQLRRSLTVYAHRSGMVSLPALKAQLQHITDEMRAYYSDGYSRAANLVFDKDHVSHEWNAAKGESSYFGYVMSLLFGDDDILGQGAKRLAETVSHRSRKETLKLFREGKLAYRDTALGGCTATEDCKLSPLEPIPFDCLKTNCANIVVFSKRLDLVIQSQHAAVAVLERDEVGSVEYRLEASNLKTLLEAKSKLKRAGV